MLREWFESKEDGGAELSRILVEQILESGLEPVEPPPLLPPISPEDIELLCWMGIEGEATQKMLESPLDRQVPSGDTVRRVAAD